jgi:Flp pilus assembly secretin CpaC
MTAWCRGRLRSPTRLAWLAAGFLLLLAASVLSASAGSEPIVVFLDQARVMKLPDRAATVVVGNPLIADISIEPGGIGVITGKGFGATNFIVMDKGGTVLMEKAVEVTTPVDKTVVVYRGVNQETYSCTPICERRITLGDFPDYFDKTINQTVTRNSQAVGAAAAH